mgnify:CR=1 FL=1
MGAEEPLLRVEGVGKAYFSNRVLKNVNFTLGKGRILGLVGENGAGKSTLMNILFGMRVIQETGGYEGKILIDGSEVSFRSPMDALKAGIGMVHQEFSLIPGFTVAENIVLNRETLVYNPLVEAFGDRLTTLERAAMTRRADEAISKLNIELDSSTLISELPVGYKQFTEIAREIDKKGTRLLVLDEPTAVLTESEADVLLDSMRRLARHGISIIFISHRLQEVMSVCDDIVILRDGEVVLQTTPAETSVRQIAGARVGRRSDGGEREEEQRSHADKVAMEISHLWVDMPGETVRNVSLTVYEGEILGIGGLSDCGIHTLGKVLYGLIPPSRGEVRKDAGQRVKSPSWAVRHGMAYVSKNRDTESMMLVCSVKDNVCLPSLHDLAAFGPISPKKQKKLAAQWSKRMEVKANSIETYCNALSGGNKQKVVLAKWLGKGAEILILDCPTRGIDVGTKAAIYQLIEELKAEGRSIVLISEELPELIGMSDRILLLKDGGISGEFFRRDGLTEAKLIEKMI